MENEKVYQMKFAKIYDLLVNKAVRKERTKEEVDEIIRWLTGDQIRRIFPKCTPTKSKPKEDQRCDLRGACRGD